MKGFTLVELMVSLAVFGLIAAAGVAVLGMSVDNRVAVAAFADRTAALQQSRSLMKADLAQAADRRVRGPDGRPEAQAFAGGQGDVLLALTRRGWSNPEEAPRASLQRVEYRVIDGRLERRVRTALDGVQIGSPQILQHGVRTARVTFIDRGMESAAWTARPDRALPDAVRLELELEGYGAVSQLFLVGTGVR